MLCFLCSLIGVLFGVVQRTAWDDGGPVFHSGYCDYMVWVIFPQG